jgi:ribonuclease D
MAVLRELYLLREQLAEERDCPPFKSVGDRVLVALAETAPSSMRSLKQVKGLAPSQVQRYGEPILQAVARGGHAPVPHVPPRPPEIDVVVMERFTALRDWRRLRAEQRGVESDVIVSKDALWGLAFKAPQTLDEMRSIRGLGPWRIETYGAEILDVIERSRNGA